MDDLNGTAPVIESGRFRFLFLSFLRMFIFVGRGCEGKNHKEREVFAALRSPPLLKVLSLAHVSQSETAQFCSAKHALPLSLSAPL